MENIPTKKELDHQLKLKSMHFNRYLIFRYITAIFFFVNLYWCVLSFSNVNLSIILPLTLLIVDLAIIIEQTAKYWYPSTNLLMTKIGYIVQISANLLGIITIVLGQQQLLFSFINDQGRGLLLTVLALGCLIGLFVEWRIWQIEQNKDAYLKHMEIFENSL